MQTPELAVPLVRVLQLTNKKVTKIILWSSIASFIEVCMLLAFMPIISAVTSQSLPGIILDVFSSDNFIINYSVFLLGFIFLSMSIRLYAQHGLLDFGFGVSESVSSIQLKEIQRSPTKDDHSDIVRSVIGESDNFGANYVVPLLTVVVRAIFLFVLFAVISIFYPLATISVIGIMFFLFVIFGPVVRKLLIKFGDKRYKANTGRFYYAMSLVRNSNVFRFYRALDKAEYSFDQTAKSYRQSQTAQQLFLITPRLFIEGIFFLSFLGLIFLSSFDTTGIIEPQNLVILFGVILRGIPSLQILIQNLNLVRFNLNAAYDVVSRVPSKTFIVQKAAKSLPAESRLKVGDFIKIYDYEFKNNAIEISGAPIEFVVGQNVLIRGKSGGGKTTFLQLLTGGLTFARVSVSVNGLDVNPDSFFADLRGRSGFSPQYAAVVKGSLIDNLFLTQIESDFHLPRFELACKSACLDFVTSPSSFEIKEDGLNLSGGEGQRINIMRSLYHSELACFADEMTASLDKETEYSVIKELAQNYKNVSFIVVSHRDLSDLGFDKEYKIVKGRVISR
jgi:ABC-type transport system involved in cytochrome bd biosynthesis fused ATPase/permease subunit